MLHPEPRVVALLQNDLDGAELNLDVAFDYVMKFSSVLKETMMGRIEKATSSRRDEDIMYRTSEQDEDECKTIRA